MLSVGSVLLIFIIMMISVLLGGKYLLQLLIEKTVGQKHRDAEIIVETGQPPAHWIKKTNLFPYFKIKRVSYKSRCLRKLSFLIDYFENNNLITDEETKQILTRKLSEIYDNWEHRKASDFMLKQR